MPDLSHKASAQYWFEYPDPTIYRVITFLESVESWTKDGDPAIESALEELGRELDDIEKVDLGVLHEEQTFVRMVGNLKSGRGLRILQAIDMVHPGSASRVLMYAEENSGGSQDPLGVFLKRNIAFERLRLLLRVFSESRLKLVIRALEGEE